MTVAIYLDNQATTRVDPRVVDAMLPYWTEEYGNAASVHHRFGWTAKEAINAARETVARGLNANEADIFFTSGATESNNMAIRGVADLPRSRGGHFISVATEHSAVIDPLKRLQQRGFDVTFLPVREASDERAGVITARQVADAIRDNTVLVSVMMANNEIGVIQPIAEIGRICRDRRIFFHTDATQAIGKIPVDVEALNVDALSFSAHKFHGPKGVGVFLLKRHAPYVRIEPLLRGGGHERGLRSGTSNVPGIVGLAHALKLCLDEMEKENERIAMLRNGLYGGLCNSLDGVDLNGPVLSQPEWRLACNLNVSFAGIDGETLLMSTPEIAASSGSACGSFKPEPSRVLAALGVTSERARGSIRFSLGRFNTAEEIEQAVEAITRSVKKLREEKTP